MRKEINQLTKLLKQHINRKIEEYKKLNVDSFKIDLQGIDWTFATKNNVVNLGFEAFLRLFNTTLDKHVPIKVLTKNERKDKLKTWGTEKIKKSETKSTGK